MALIENVSCVYEYVIDSYNKFEIKRKAVIHKIFKNGSFRFKFEGDKFVSIGYVDAEENYEPKRRVRVGSVGKYNTFRLTTTKELTELEFREYCRYALREEYRELLERYKMYKKGYERLTTSE